MIVMDGTALCREVNQSLNKSTNNLHSTGHWKVKPLMNRRSDIQENHAPWTRLLMINKQPFAAYMMLSKDYFYNLLFHYKFKTLLSSLMPCFLGWLWDGRDSLGPDDKQNCDAAWFYQDKFFNLLHQKPRTSMYENNIDQLITSYSIREFMQLIQPI